MCICVEFAEIHIWLDLILITFRLQSAHKEYWSRVLLPDKFSVSI